MAPGPNPSPTFEIDRPALLVAAALHFALLFVPIVHLDVPRWVFLAGFPVGVVAGVLTPTYGDAMNNGLAACLLGGLFVILGALVYGSYVSWRVGFGVDSLLAGVYGFLGLWMVFAVPVHAVQAVFAAVGAHVVRIRVEERLAAR